MAEQNFVDYVKICCRSGAGGAGSKHFASDPINPRGGPDGGDGGRGGHIIVKGNKQMWTLLPLKYRKHVIAGDGGNGAKNNRFGKYGEDIVLEVPIGTIVRDVESGEITAEINEDGQEIIIAKGGRGGLGNVHFKSATNQAPQYAQPGEPGVEEWKILELKVLADVGLVGFPNAGKSTLLAAITAAKPKIDSYPFTTIVPNLGIVPYHGHMSFIMADIPGIIEDAHLGKGLGHRFLKHIERNAVLLFMVPADTDHIGNEYNVLLHELEMFNEELLDKPRILAVTKSDMIDDELKEMLKSDLPPGIKTVFISSVTNKGLKELKDMLWQELNPVQE
ncbi:MAG TPA: GTPase ObgE [Saprospiraceae bacterium]|nr:GTPase ObgE [Saprospiraceae bacterium]MCC6688967.1 GTPase ObgE [Saprospiraceae bacterium]HMX81780.1 GTPase ObgE [Saprospiraceae bacterium]HMX85593.1 GTPase ObgE [Saprospiraceae bacterium]HNG11724.1 GTPase ObgE [Saprospiraceae bacterium]